MEDALKCYDAAFTIQSNVTDIFSNKGMALIKLQRYGEASDVFDRILAIDPNNVGGLYNKGVTLKKIGYTDEANKYYKVALNFNLHYKPVLINRLRLALSPDKAEPFIEQSDIKNKSFNIKNETGS